MFVHTHMQKGGGINFNYVGMLLVTPGEFDIIWHAYYFEKS
jgi:hypothetical protein